MTVFKQLNKRRLIPHDAAHPSGTPVLEVKELSFRYDGRPALEEVSFSLTAGQRIALVGPNGAGKSTLFKVIAGVLSPSSGQVNIYGRGPDVHNCIAYVTQRSQVDWDFPVSVADVVMMGRIGKLGPVRWPRAADWERVRASLKVVSLEDLADRRIAELSGGQQQRMFIARALAQEAELMLMDEPFTGLDLNSQEEFLNILDELRQRSVTVVVAMHDLQLASEHFEQVLLLNRRVLGFGPPQTIFTPERLQTAYGGHLRLVGTGDDLLALSDTCCDEPHEVRS